MRLCVNPRASLRHRPRRRHRLRGRRGRRGFPPLRPRRPLPGAQWRVGCRVLLHPHLRLARGGRHLRAGDGRRAVGRRRAGPHILVQHHRPHPLLHAGDGLRRPHPGATSTASPVACRCIWPLAAGTWIASGSCLPVELIGSKGNQLGEFRMWWHRSTTMGHARHCRTLLRQSLWSRLPR